ncbi:MAG: iron-containing alcohol dehydrogenase [Roseburia sp.]
MKFDFTYYNPTKIYFGKTALEFLEPELQNYGENVLLVYGKAAIKKIGLYDSVIEILRSAKKNVVELGGIKPNPTYEQMMAGAKLVRDNAIDLILAVGGGSVIDCAKAISVSAYCDGDAWKKYWIDFEELSNKTVPVASILTMVGTGSEMNGGSVITKEEEWIKAGRVFPASVNPKFSILNPEYTFHVPKEQMVSGVFDVMSHLMEQYFSGDDDNTTDYVIEGIMKSLIHSTRIALKNPTDYEARSNMMWCATMALNTITGLSKEQDWEVHYIEHQIGAYTDCPHGIGLAIVSVPYYRSICEYGIDKFVRFAETIWNVEAAGKSKREIAEEGLDCLYRFIVEMGIPTSLRSIGTTEEMLPAIADSCLLGGAYKKISREDILTILKSCF